MAINSAEKSEGKVGRHQARQKIKTSELSRHRSQRFNNFLADSSLRSEKTDISDRTNPMLGASSSSVGDFSRVMGSSLSMSRVTMMEQSSAASMAQRGTMLQSSQKDPLSMINMYTKKQQ